ncbi:MAG: hypothetical protein ABI759_04695 [Candidatus Solibacter sp.]
MIIRIAVCAWALWIAVALGGQSGPALSYLYTQAPAYDSHATLPGTERFPSGATLQFVSNGSKREFLPAFAASADAAVSFDGQRVLFAAKKQAAGPWQIWEAALREGAPRRITRADETEDSLAPFYLPGDRIVYAQRTASGFQIMRAALTGGEAQQLTYGPGNHIPTGVLQDGRILFEAAHAAGQRDLFTVYPDGTGVETYRCDHGPDRSSARQLASGDILFNTAGALARFTSARAVQVSSAQPKGEVVGPVSEIAPADWLVSLRTAANGTYSLYRWRGGEPELLAGHGLQPVLARPHAAPKSFPSALRERPGANLLCLNVYTSRTAIPSGTVTTVRVWTLDDHGAPVAMGQAPVERDGSFYVQAPGERPLRFELLDAAGKIVAAEKGWFWARRGEQRVCVGCHAGPEHAPENAVPETLLRSTDPAIMTLPVHDSTGGAK